MSHMRSPASVPAQTPESSRAVRSLKAEIRRTLLHETRQLSPSAVLERSQRICQILLHHPAIQNANGIALYHAMPHEVTLLPLVISLRDAGKHLFLPRVLGPDSLGFFAWHSQDLLERSAFGILEPPATSQQASPGDIDTFLIPGVGFDGAGNRLGYGKGYYDRALLPFVGTARFFGVCFSLQRVPVLPTEPWDLLMQEVISEPAVTP